VFWPGARAAFPGPIDLASVAIAAVALVLLVKFRADVIAVIAGSALAGVALGFLGG